MGLLPAQYSARLLATRLYATRAVVYAESSAPQSSGSELYDDDKWFELRDAVETAEAPSFYRGAVAGVSNDLPPAGKELGALIGSGKKSWQAREAPWFFMMAFERAGRFSSIHSDDPLLKALARLPDQTVGQQRYSKTRYSTRNSQMFLPVSVDGKSAEYQFDTGANYSVLSESEARRLGVTVHPANATIADGATGMRFAISGVAEADLTVGELEPVTSLSWCSRTPTARSGRELSDYSRYWPGKPCGGGVDGVFEIGFRSTSAGKPNLCLYLRHEADARGQSARSGTLVGSFTPSANG